MRENEILTGEHPFPNLTMVERLYKHLNEPLPEDIMRLLNEVPSGKQQDGEDKGP